jgi:hypothetical protein
MVVPRKELKATIGGLLRILMKKPSVAAASASEGGANKQAPALPAA